MKIKYTSSKDESLFEKAETDPSVVANLDPQSGVECMVGCSIYWTYFEKENKFHGCTKEGMCRFDSKFFPGKTIIASSDIYIGPKELWTQDRGVDTDGNKLYGFKSEDHHKFLRCIIYRGKAVVKGMEEEIEIYDQGGIVKFRDEDYSIKLVRAGHDVDYQNDVVKLSLMNSEEVVGIAMSAFDSSFIGLKFASVEVYLIKQS